MHECSVTESIIKISVEKAKEAKAIRINNISLVIGELTGFMVDSIQFYFDHLSKGTIAEGAKIDIRQVKSRLKCSKCSETFERKRFDFSCPMCGGDGMPTDIGNECYIENLEIDEADE
jgi:hydrogenase nickel incorporation protein HypA/HybF